MPEQVVMVDGDSASVVFTQKDIHDGRDVWRRVGGMELGSVWGHGSYLAPDWTADVLQTATSLPFPNRSGRHGLRDWPHTIA